MRINNTNTADGTKLALLLVTLIVTVSAVSCGNNSDGDVTAYCDVISKNLDLGVPDTNLPIDQLDLLITLAPSEVKKVVTKIRNTSADVAEISALDQLFAATFDPEAIDAQNTFQIYNSQNCNINTDIVEDLVSATQASIQSELEQFLSVNYEEENWGNEAQIDVVFNGIVIVGVKGSLALGSGFQDAESLCQALSLWLYAVKEVEGTVIVSVGENEVIERSSENLSCTTKEIEQTD